MKTKIFWKSWICKSIILLGLIFSYNCKDNNQSNYIYFEDFSFYLKNSHQLDINEQDKIYYLIPINGCENCIELNLGLLNQLPKSDKLQAIIIGETFDQEKIQILESIKKNHSLIYDEKEEIFQYQTGFSKPMIVGVKNGKCYFHLDVSDFKIDEAKAFLGEHLL